MLIRHGLPPERASIKPQACAVRLAQAGRFDRSVISGSTKINSAVIATGMNANAGFCVASHIMPPMIEITIATL